MGEKTKIEWTDHSWSPWRGCTKVSPGCAHCYAETLSKRNPAVLGQWGKGKPRVRAKNWQEPVRWNKDAAEFPYHCEKCGTRIADPEQLGSPFACPTCNYVLSPYRPRVFPSLCDWLDDEVPIEWLADFLKRIHATPYLTWQLLTKRPENFRPRLRAVLDMVKVGDGDGGTWQSMTAMWAGVPLMDNRPPANVWFGVSVEDRPRKERLEALNGIPAAVKFCSFEPLLEDLELTRDDVRMLDWAIIGGESGPGSRPCNVDWISPIITQCRSAGVACFVKQMGSNCITDNANLHDWPDATILESRGEAFAGARARFRHAKGGDWSEWPEELRVRQFPEAL